MKEHYTNKENSLNSIISRLNEKNKENETLVQGKDGELKNLNKEIKTLTKEKLNFSV